MVGEGGADMRERITSEGKKGKTRKNQRVKREENIEYKMGGTRLRTSERLDTDWPLSSTMPVCWSMSLSDSPRRPQTPRVICSCLACGDLAHCLPIGQECTNKRPSYNGKLVTLESGFMISELILAPGTDSKHRELQ